MNKVPKSIVDIQISPDRLYIFVRTGEIKTDDILDALEDFGVKPTIEHFKSPCG